MNKDSQKPLKPKLECTTKISKSNLERIEKLKTTGYEPNDYIISQALTLLENQKNTSSTNTASNLRDSSNN